MIFSKFLRQLRFGNKLFRMVESNAFYSNYHDIIENLLKRHTASVRLAVLADDPDVVLGWALVEPQVLHFVYVCEEQRRQGIARELCSKGFEVVTHMTKDFTPIFNKLKGVIFDPWR